MPTSFLDHEGDRIAWDLRPADDGGSGPLALAIPGMVDVRATYRHLAPLLTAAGFRFASLDLRGHGESGTAFASFDDEAGARDVIALLDHLGSPALLIGNSMGAAIATIVAARRPDLVTGLVLLGPFVRDGEPRPIATALMKVATLPALIATTWNAYLPTLYAGRRPEDFDSARRALIAMVREPGRAAAISRTTRTSHRPAEEAIDDVVAPVLIVMGEEDPDFADPRSEAAWIADRTAGRVLMLAETGHYPQAQQPEAVAAAILEWQVAGA